MVRHYFTLKKLVEELKSLVGLKLIECFSQEKDTIELAFFNYKDIIYLKYNSQSKYASLYLDKNFARARSNSVDLMPEIVGDTLQNISLIPNDRIIKLEFINNIVYISMFGASNSNLFVCDKNFKILNALNEPEKYKNTNFKENIAVLQSIFEIDKTFSLKKALTQSDLLLGKEYASELCYELDLDPDLPLSAFGDDKLRMIDNAAMQLIGRILDSDKYYLLKQNENAKTILSLIPLRDFPIIIGEIDNLSNAIRHTIVQNIIDEKRNSIYKELNNILSKEVKKLEKKIQDFQYTIASAERAEKYKLYAEILLSQANPKQKYGAKLETIDWASNPISIPLDEKLNLIDNAKKYYSKASKENLDIRQKQKMLPKVEEKFDTFKAYLNRLNNAKTVKELENLRKEIAPIVGIAKMQNEPRQASDKYKVFILDENYTLYVGKNAQNNDELTMKFAKANDLWLHARGSSGSHAVLRGNTERIPKDILKKAAEICAYYSGARNAKYTPVCYTLRKNVRKPKGANVGAVVISREEVIMVEPKIPENSEI